MFYTSNRNVDFVFCVDGTGSMAPCIESVKKDIRRFIDDCIREMTDIVSEIGDVRIKLIVFRDYGGDGDDAMQESPFFSLPADRLEFEKYLSGIAAFGGKSGYANGLEALYFAMKSDFVTGRKDRQIIALFTNNDAVKLGTYQHLPNYPTDMVDEDELIEMWSFQSERDCKLRERSKRLVLFAPPETKYEDLKCSLNRSIFYSVTKEDGFDNIEDIFRLY